MGDLEDRVILYNMDDFVRPQGKYPENFYDIMLNFWLNIRICCYLQFFLEFNFFTSFNFLALY